MWQSYKVITQKKNHFGKQFVPQFPGTRLRGSMDCSFLETGTKFVASEKGSRQTKVASATALGDK